LASQDCLKRNGEHHEGPNATVSGPSWFATNSCPTLSRETELYAGHPERSDGFERHQHREFTLMRRMVVPEHPVPMQADPFRLGQVLRKVRQNAITHTPPTGQISSTLRVDGNTSVISVVDTGRSIPADQRPLIWIAFPRRSIT
jgi:signal transduction histidine kinase